MLGWYCVHLVYIPEWWGVSTDKVVGLLRPNQWSLLAQQVIQTQYPAHYTLGYPTRHTVKIFAVPVPLPEGFCKGHTSLMDGGSF